MLTKAAAGLRRLRGSAPLRRSALRRIGALTVALLIATSVGLSATRAAHLRHRWDPTVEVLVALRDLPIGTSIQARDLAVRSWPAALVPAGYVEALPPPSTLVTADIMAGEPLVEHRTDRASSVPVGRGVVEIESPAPMPSVRAGDHVDVLASPPAVDELARLIDPDRPGPDLTDPDLTGTGSDQRRSERVEQPVAMVVAEDAIVMGAVDSEAASLTLAVADADVSATAAALLEGPVALVVRPPPR
jgi:hypothetical protein